MIRSFFYRLFSKKRIEAPGILKGMQCPKRYWFETHDPLHHEAASDERLKMMMRTQVKEAAKGLFPGGVAVTKEGKAGADETKQRLRAPSGVLFNAVFEGEGVRAVSDVVAWDDEGVRIYQVKSSSGIKESYYTESALLWQVMRAAGVKVNKAFVIYLNNRYERNGELDLFSLLEVKPITQVLRRRQDAIRQGILRVQRIGAAMPEIAIGPQCNDPYPCDYRIRCWAHVPTPSVFDLHKLPGKKKFELFRQGIVRFEEIPADFPLRPEQTRQIEAELHGREFIDAPAIAAFLKGLHFPLYFLDFETYQQAVPEFDRVRPFEQIPFQFSLHRLDAPEAEPAHYEFLGRAGQDPREELAQALCRHIGPEGSIIAYNQSFEKGVIKRLAEQSATLRNELDGMLGRFTDLMLPFEKGWYYTRAMKGRHSIKAVLPALVPELSYSVLAIGDGGEAMVRYALLHLENDPDKVEQTRKELLEYCRLDTFAMVKIWEKLAQATADCS